MNKTIIEFYEDFGLSVQKIIARRPSEVNRLQVEIAIEKMYEKLNSGEEFKPITIPREIWRIASEFSDVEYKKAIKEREDFKNNFNKYQMEFKRLKKSSFVLAIICMLYILYRICQCVF